AQRAARNRCPIAGEDLGDAIHRQAIVRLSYNDASVNSWAVVPSILDGRGRVGCDDVLSVNRSKCFEHVFDGDDVLPHVLVSTDGRAASDPTKVRRVIPSRQLVGRYMYLLGYHR